MSTVPLTLTVSICPFTDSVLGGGLLQADTLTVEREMWICNNITGNKERHGECAYPELKKGRAISFKALVRSAGGGHGKYLFSLSVTICRWCCTFHSSFLLFLLLPLGTSANLCSGFLLAESKHRETEHIRCRAMLEAPAGTQPDTMKVALGESGDPTWLFHLNYTVPP